MVEDKAGLKREIDKIQRQLDKLTTKLDSLAEAEKVGRIRTFIRGFDEKIGGGIPISHVVLLAGPTGTMKSSLAMSVLSRLVQKGSTGTYLTLEESKDSLLQTADDLDMEMDEESIVDIGEMRRVEDIAGDAGNWFDVIIKYLSKAKKRRKISLVVLDSLDAVQSFDRESASRDAVSKFFHSLRDLGLTAIIIDEAEGPMRFKHHEDRAADGIIFLGCDISHKREMRLTIHCGKMRHTKHSMDYFHLNFENGEFFISDAGAQ